MQKEKYYRMRKELVWGAGILAALLLFSTAFGKMEDTADMPQQEEFTPMEFKELPAVQSELSDPEGCYLCGTAKERLMGYFRQFDDLGVICVNQWYVLDMGILGQDMPDGEKNGTRTAMTGTGEGGDFFSSTQIPSRGISTVEVRYGEDSILDVQKAKTILCQKCLDRLLSVMETYGPEGEEPKPRNLCLVDFQTLELYCLQEQYASYYIRDYYVRLDRQRTGWRLRRFMRRSGIDGIFRGKSGRLPLCYPVPMWYDESILREGSGIGCRSRNVRWM